MSALREYDYNCFPVVENRHQRVLLGTVHRCVFSENFTVAHRVENITLALNSLHLGLRKQQNG